MVGHSGCLQEPGYGLRMASIQSWGSDGYVAYCRGACEGQVGFFIPFVGIHQFHVAMKPLLVIAHLMWIATCSGQWEQTDGPYGGLMSAPVQVGNDLFVGTWGGGVLRSTNNGVHWEAVNTGLSNLADLSTARMSVFNGVIYAATDGGMFSSVDQGGSWTQLAEGWADGMTSSILIEGQHIFIGTWGSGIVRSLDGGLTWGWANTGLPGSAGISKIIRCGSYLFCNGWNGVFRSMDDGGTWTTVNTPTEQPDIEVIDSTIFIVDYYSTASRSVDFGVTWQSASTGLGPHVTSMKSNGTDLYAGTTTGGVYRTTNAGIQWSLLGSLSTEVENISILGTTIYASTWSNGVGDLFVSTDDGGTWTLTTNDMIATRVHAVDLRNGVLHAGTAGNGFFTSADAGDTWNALNSGLPQNMEIRCISANGPDLLIGGDAGAYASANGAVSWNFGGMGLTNSSMTRMARIGSNVFAATASGIFITTNNGSNWTPVNSGLGSDPYMMDVFAQADTLYACGSTGVYTSTNYGNSWTALNNGLPMGFFRGIVKNNGVLLTYDINQMYRSTDNGASWSSIGFSAPQCMISEGNTVVVGFLGMNNTDDVVYRSSDEGLNWTSMTGNIGNTKILALATDGLMLYAGTRGSGIWKRPLEDITTGVPGPADDSSVRVRFNIAAGILLVDLGNEPWGKAQVSVTDVSGRLIHGTHIDDGSATLPMRLATGVYLVTISSGDRRVTKRFAVMD